MDDLNLHLLLAELITEANSSTFGVIDPDRAMYVRHGYLLAVERLQKEVAKYEAMGANEYSRANFEAASLEAKTATAKRKAAKKDAAEDSEGQLRLQEPDPEPRCDSFGPGR